MKFNSKKAIREKPFKEKKPLLLLLFIIIILLLLLGYKVKKLKSKMVFWYM